MLLSFKQGVSWHIFSDSEIQLFILPEEELDPLVEKLNRTRIKQEFSGIKSSIEMFKGYKASFIELIADIKALLE